MRAAADTTPLELLRLNHQCSKSRELLRKGNKTMKRYVLVLVGMALLGLPSVAAADLYDGEYAGNPANYWVADTGSHAVTGIASNCPLPDRQWGTGVDYCTFITEVNPTSQTCAQ